MTSATLDVETQRLLVAQAQRGDQPAADRLVREHEGWVRGVIYGVSGRSDLVDDVAQQVWTRVWQRLDSLKDPERLRPWLYAIARRAAIDAGVDHKRRREGTVRLEHAGQTRGDERSRNPLRLALSDELHATLLQAVESLPVLYREPFVLRHLEDWSYAQIGAVLALPVETVETRLVRARRLLRETLQGKVER
ncbi:MAG: RNA polymerase sigma factor [Planctomycetes bacterium]|nr:RNA polymerase sigma factor [Planctomycetota bacterium]